MCWKKCVTDKTLSLIINYTYQVWYVVATSAISCCVDSFFLSMASEASLRLDVLAARFRSHKNDKLGNGGECNKIDLMELCKEHKACLRYIYIMFEHNA